MIQIKNSLVLTISLLLIVVVAIAGFFYFQIKKTSKRLQTQVQIQPTPSMEAKDPTTKWKTYVNDKLGIEFKYPTGWSVPKELSQSINFNGQLIIVKGPFYDQGLQRDLNFDEYVVRNYGDETPRYDFNMNGLIGKRGLEKSVLNYKDIVVLAKDNKSTDIITISYIYDPKKEDGKVFGQILSTFKLLVNNLTTSIPADYQIPTNSTCSFSVAKNIFIALNIDTPSPKCSKIFSNQGLVLTNTTNKNVNLDFANINVQILPNNSYIFSEILLSSLAPGVHVITTSLYGEVGPELWVQ